MMNLNEMLLKEQLRLEKIVKEAGARLKNAPEGTLRLSGCRKSIQYYRCLPGGRKNGEYLIVRMKPTGRCATHGTGSGGG